MFGMEASTLESQASRAGRQQQLDAAILQRPRFIVLMGVEFSELLAAAAGQAPATRFLWLGHCLDKVPANLHCIQFREAEVSYLAGLEAGWSSTSGKVGVLGPLDSPARRAYAEAFAAGAKAARPGILIHPVQWVGGEQPFNDGARAEQVAKSMLAAGVDVIYAIAANSNQGVLRALAGQNKAKMIGHPVNQCHMLPGKVIDSVEIHYDAAITLAIGEILHGAARPQMDFGLKENVLSLTASSTDAALSECEIARERALVQKIRQERQALLQRK
jgi:basic membrane protein A